MNSAPEPKDGNKHSTRSPSPSPDASTRQHEPQPHTKNLTSPPEFANDTTFIRRFEVEAQLVARLEHPHIVPLHDYWRTPDGAFLVLRWLRGGSVQDRLRGGPLTLTEAGRLLAQIGAALAYAHRHGVSTVT